MENEISSFITQVKEMIPKLDESVASLQRDIPPKMNFSLLNIRAALSTIDDKKSLRIADKRDDSIPITEDHITQIELTERYLTKHLNNAFTEHFSELGNKTKDIESKFIFPSSKTSLVSNSNKVIKDFEDEMEQSLSSFNLKCQTLNSQISELAVQKKFNHTTNQMTVSLESHIKQQKKDIDLLKNRIDRTHTLMNSALNTNTNYNNINNPSAGSSTISDTQSKFNRTTRNKVIDPLEEQKRHVQGLMTQWTVTCDTLKNELSNIDQKLHLTVQTAQNIHKSISSVIQRLDLLETEKKKIEENFDVIQERITDEEKSLNDSTEKEDVAKMTFNVEVAFDGDQQQVDELEDYVNQLYDKISTTYST